MRVLPERTDPDREGDAGQDSASQRCADPRVDERDLVPLHDLLPRAGGNQARRKGHGRGANRRGEGGGGMKTSRIPKEVEQILKTHRRGFLRNAGLLMVSVGAGGTALVRE